MPYELKLLREHFDDLSQTHHLHVRLHELDDAGNEVSHGEEYQRGFCLPGHEDSTDFYQELANLKADLVKRYEGTKLHRASLRAGMTKHLS
jgi:CHASE3 domain sensor protein